MALPVLLDPTNDKWQHKAQMTKDIKIVFAEGCFDNFEGTQDELNELVADLRQQLQNGTLFDNAVPLAEDEANVLMQLIENKSERH